MNSCLSIKVQFLTINVVWWVCKHNWNRHSNAFSVFYLYKNRKIMLEIIQHFLLQNYKTILHIYIYIYIHKYFWDTGCHSFHSGHFFVHAPIHLHTHGLIISMHMKSLTQTAPKVSSVRFVYYFMHFETPHYLSLSNSPFPISRKSAVICRWSARNYRNKPYIAEKRTMSAVKSNLNYVDGANDWRVMVTWIQLC